LKHLHEKDTEDMKKKPDVELKFEAMWRTRKGTQIMNPNKVNQDRVLVEESIRGLDLDLYAVADGHGVFGHYVSHSLLTNLTQTLLDHLKYQTSLRKVLKQGYNDLQSHLEKNPDMNAECSGSTLVTVVVEEKKRVICGNVGDSRAIIGRESKYFCMIVDGSNWEVVRLSNDHKPSVDREKRRILRAGGRVEKIKDEDGNTVGPSRVWLPKKRNKWDKVEIQGLAMSRSMGDNISKCIGVIHEPEILSH
jgi:serine/threonine protein phosphatase PrpC